MEQVFGKNIQQYFKRQNQVGYWSIVIPEHRIIFRDLCSFYTGIVWCCKNFNGLVKKVHKVSSTLKYLYQFDSGQEGPLFKLGARNSGFNNLALSRDADYQSLKNRFARLSDMWPTKLGINGGSGALISFTGSFESSFFNNCLLVNKYEEIYRVKHIYCT